MEFLHGVVKAINEPAMKCKFQLLFLRGLKVPGLGRPTARVSGFAVCGLHNLPKFRIAKMPEASSAHLFLYDHFRLDLDHGTYSHVVSAYLEIVYM